jgi:hypothetical protein
MEDKFKIKSYGYGELAQMYFPNISKRSATDQFRKWLVNSTSLMENLKNTGYKPKTRLLKPIQVKLIIESFGEP